MTNSPEGRISASTAKAPTRPESDTAKSWFVPPIVVPAFFLFLIAARAIYTAYFWPRLNKAALSRSASRLTALALDQSCEPLPPNLAERKNADGCAR
jgi:hypothetical protein